MARQGKIARMPHDVRTQVNQMLHDGKKGGEICAWLNGLPAAQEVCREYFDGEPVKEQNLSDWRRGGYADWLRKLEAVEEQKTLREFSVRMAEASGGRLSQGALAIASGKMLDMLQSSKDALDPKEFAEWMAALAKLSNEEVKHSRLDLANEEQRGKREDRALKKAALDLARKKWETEVSELFLDLASSPDGAARLQEVLGSKRARPAQVTEIRRLLFGDREARKALRGEANG